MSNDTTQGESQKEVTQEAKAEETQETATTETETASSQAETAEDNWDDFEKGLGEYVGQTLEEKPEEEKAEETKEESETEEVKEEAETETKEEAKEESKEESANEEKEEIDLSALTIKRNGEEIPVIEAIKEMYKENPDEAIADIRERFDYYKKTQELATEKQGWEEQKTKAENDIKFIQMENIAHEVGGYAGMVLQKGTDLTEQDFIDMKDGEDYVYTDDEARQEFQKYQSSKLMLNQYFQNKKETYKKNEQMIADFGRKYGMDRQKIDAEVLPTVNKYLNPTVTKGQTPFPSDTLDVFYKGANFEKLVKEEVEKARKEERKKIISEKNKVKSQEIPEVKSEKQETVEADIDDDMDEVMKALDAYNQ